MVERGERVRVAISNSGYKFPTKKVIVNMAPANLRKEGPAFDLPMALGILAASGAMPARAFPELTERERGVLDLIVQGLSNPEIASRLYLSPKTVRNHISNIFSKLQVADRAQAIVRAREAGLG